MMATHIGIERLLEDGILTEGHFAFRSGLHSAGLIDRDRLLADPAATAGFGYKIAKHFFTSHVETIATPSIWGSGLAQFVGYFLDPRANVVNATPGSKGLSIADHVEYLVEDKHVLLVDNLIVSGETMQGFSRLIEANGGKVVGIATLWCGALTTISGHQVFGLLNDRYPAYPPDDCPLCVAGNQPPVVVGY